MQLTGHTAAFFFLGVKDTLGEGFEFHVGKATFADVQGQTRGKDQQNGGQGDTENIEECRPDPLFHTSTGRGDGRLNIVDENAGAHDPAPILQAHGIGHHRRGFSGAGFGPVEGVIAATCTGDFNKPVGDFNPIAVTQTGPVLVNQLRLTRAHKVVAVIIKDKEITVLSVDHRGKDLRHLKHRCLVVGQGGPVDIAESGPCNREIVFQLGLLGLDQLHLKRLDLLFCQSARLNGHQNRNRRHRHDQWQCRKQEKLLAVGQPEEI